MNQHRDHAVVIGASMAGLLAARVLSEHYRSVTVIERDELPDRAANRRGVPQGQHVHALLPAGATALDGFFPGLVADLETAGTPIIDRPDMTYWSILGHRFCESQREIPVTVQASRPLLEGMVRARVLGLPGVSVRQGESVVEPLTDARRSRVTGVRVTDASTGSEEEVRADLVVDASGRAARTPGWLEKMGYGRPDQDEVKVRLTYVSQLMRFPGRRPDVELVFIGPAPSRPLGFGLFHYENDTWLLSVAGIGGAAPGSSRDAMIAAIADFAPASVMEALGRAVPLSDVVRFGYPASQRRHYERMRRFPEGLLVVGDAICSFNPIYGQGMSVAALEAQDLDRVLREGDADLARRFFTRAARTTAVAWELAIGSDLALPQIDHPRSVRVRLVNSWVDKVLAAAESDEDVALQFFRVIALLDPPQRLMSPRMVRHVLRPARPAAAGVSATAVAR